MIPFILSQLLFGLPYLIGIVVIAAMARGAARVLGTIGCVILLIGHILNAVWSIMLPQIMRDFDLPVSMASIPSIIFAIVSALGMILVICAVVAGRRKQESPQQLRPGGPPPNPMQGPPMQQQPPQQQPGYPSYGQQPGPYQPGPQ
jgi:hypothetical protein